MWGEVPAGKEDEQSLCSSASLPEIDLVVYEESLVPFTACDNEELPVSHSLPSSIDSRVFSALYGGEPRVFRYQGDGLYQVSVRAEQHGRQQLQIELNGTAVVATPLDLVAVCPASGKTVTLDSGAMSRSQPAPVFLAV